IPRRLAQLDAQSQPPCGQLRPRFAHLAAGLDARRLTAHPCGRPRHAGAPGPVGGAVGPPRRGRRRPRARCARPTRPLLARRRRAAARLPPARRPRLMNASAPLAFPGSRALAGWWRHLAPREPRALWVGHLLLHHLEVLVERTEQRRPDPVAGFVLKVLELFR